MNQTDRQKLETLRLSLHAVQQQLALSRQVGRALGVSLNQMSERSGGRLSTHCRMDAKPGWEARTTAPVLLSVHDGIGVIDSAEIGGVYTSGATGTGGTVSYWTPPSERKQQNFGEFDAPGNHSGRHFGGFEDTNGNKLR